MLLPKLPFLIRYVIDKYEAQQMCGEAVVEINVT